MRDRTRRRRLRDRLPDDVVEAMLRGDVAPDDAPPGYAQTAALLRAAALSGREPADTPTPQAVPIAPDILLEGTQTTRPTTAPRRPARVLVLASAAALVLTVLTGGLAGAEVLPGSAQRFVARILEVIGLDVPPGDHASVVPADTDSDADEAAYVAADSPSQVAEIHGAICTDTSEGCADQAQAASSASAARATQPDAGTDVGAPDTASPGPEPGSTAPDIGVPVTPPVPDPGPGGGGPGTPASPPGLDEPPPAFGGTPPGLDESPPGLGPDKGNAPANGNGSANRAG